MASPALRKSIVPGVLGLAMLGVIVAAALAPNTGAVAAQSSCQYNNCTASTGISPWVWVGAALVIVAAGIATFLLLARRGRSGGGSAEAGAGTPPTGGASESAGATEAAGSGEAYDEGIPEPMAPDAGTPSPADSDIDSLMNELDKISSDEK
ncbi:MAG TPA: hypothetical protein VGS23_07800 [Thermoplasmata archaeon]|nr:hypothetical protein [Thermoplasmata archaeon]